MDSEGIGDRIKAGDPLSRREALIFYEGQDVHTIGQYGDLVRRRWHPTERVTYVVDANINYGNACYADCQFCGFYDLPKSGKAWRKTNEEILAMVQHLVDNGGTQVLLQGGLDPELGIEYYEELFGQIQQRFPAVYIHSLSPPEIDHLARVEKTSHKEVLLRLREAGLRSLPGGGAEMLIDRVRDIISPKKQTADNWLAVMEAAGEIGMQITLTMMFGHVETRAERIEHLFRLRELQEKFGHARAFICWTYQPEGTALQDQVPRRTSAGEYLRTMAMGRIILDNIKTHPSGWVTEGPKVAQLGLLYGANDLGGTLWGEQVLESAGARWKMTPRKLREIIRGAGKIPAQRDTEYNILREFDPDPLSEPPEWETSGEPEEELVENLRFQD